MLHVAINRIFDWTDFYEDSFEPTLKGNELQSRQSVSNSNVYIYCCVFNNCISSGSGGAVSSTTTQKILIEETSFDSCRTSSSYNGGAVHFNNGNNGQFALNKICSYNCSTMMNKYGQFAYVIIKNAAEYKNSVYQTSIACSINMNADSWYSLYIIWHHKITK